MNVFDKYDRQAKYNKTQHNLLTQATRLIENGDPKKLIEFTKILTKHALNDVFLWATTTTLPHDLDEKLDAAFNQALYEEWDIYDLFLYYDVQKSTIDYEHTPASDSNPVAVLPESIISAYYDVFTYITGYNIKVLIYPGDSTYCGIYIDFDEALIWDGEYPPEERDQKVFETAIMELLSEIDAKQINASNNLTRETVYFEFENITGGKLFDFD